MPRDDRALRPGDLVIAELGPIRGTEQDGRRPVLVVSECAMNVETHRVIVCPITRNTAPWPTKVHLPPGLNVVGAVLTDQIRSIDQRARIVGHLGTVPGDVLEEVRYQLGLLLGIATRQWIP